MCVCLCGQQAKALIIRDGWWCWCNRSSQSWFFVHDDRNILLMALSRPCMQSARSWIFDEFEGSGCFRRHLKERPPDKAKDAKGQSHPGRNNAVGKAAKVKSQNSRSSDGIQETCWIFNGTSSVFDRRCYYSYVARTTFPSFPQQQDRETGCKKYVPTWRKVGTAAYSSTIYLHLQSRIL